MSVEDPNSGKCGGPVAPSLRARGVLRPLGHDAVQLDPQGLLGSWQERNRDVTLPWVLDHIEGGEARRNLARLLGTGDEADTGFVGMVFTDSDVYKALEAVAWTAIQLEPGDARLIRAERLVELVARAQEDDGYINSWVQGTPDVARWSDPQWGHELYTAGHLFQAAVAADRAGVLPGLLAVATRFADLLVELFAAPDSEHLDGHPQVETALVELYRVTGNERYLDVARHQIELRGHGRLGTSRFGSPYFQDAVPLRSATEGTGHAVRQVYLLTGAVDVAAETGDQDLLEAAIRVWDEMSATKTYVTGALGSRHRDEAIGDRHELPPDRAYAETCAAIAAFQLNWRLLLITGLARFAEAMETVLYNAIPASTSLSGDRFFYSNPLHLRTGHEGSHEDAPSQRLPWFSCACCPPNVARLMAGVHDYLLTHDPEGIQIQHPTSLTAQVTLPAGEVRIDVRTEYPYAGRVQIDVQTTSPDEWELAVRIPSWCRNFELMVDGDQAPAVAADGYLRIRRDWSGGTQVVLEMHLPVRQISAHPRVDAVRGCVTLARGPVVYAVEEADLPPGVVLEDVRLLHVDGVDSSTTVPIIDVVAAIEKSDSTVLYTDVSHLSAAPVLSEPFQLGLGPYHRWANRTPGAMRVWIPTAEPQHSARPRSSFKEETP
jgi:DUF1680 family protein